MPKQCQADGCNNPVASHNYCWNHQFLRNDEKYLKSLLKKYKKGQAKIKTNSKNKDKVSKDIFGFKNQVELFDYIWENTPHVCWLTGRPLGEKDVRMFAHVLRKGTYTYFKLNPKNIRLLLPTMHDLVDNFKEIYREQLPHIDFDKWFKLQDDMRIEYEVFKRKHLLS